MITLIHWDNHYINAEKIAHITYHPGKIIVGLTNGSDIGEAYSTEDDMKKALNELLDAVNGYQG